MNKDLQKLITSIKKSSNFKWIDFLLKDFKQAKIFLVGGAVRDALLGIASEDYDFVVAGVKPSDLENFLAEHGEVNLVGKSFGIYVFAPTDSTLNKAIEIALPRTDASFNTGGYKDVEVTADPNLPIEKDLERRDFTINAMALDMQSGDLVDPFNGQSDLKEKLLKAVGDPEIRFKEDYTRMLRGIRFAAQLDFVLEKKTKDAIAKYAAEIKKVSPERIIEELNKILLSKNLLPAFALMADLKIVHQILPEIAEGIGVEQGKAHIYGVYEHLVRAAQYASEKDYPLPVIMAALFHDCGKPRTKKIINGVDTYYQHEYVGEKMSKEALNRLKYPKDFTKTVSHLVRNHMFYYNQGEITDAGVRRLIAKVGPEYIDDLLRLRMADRIGMGRPKAKPLKITELEQRMKVLQTAPVTENMIKLNGDEMMALLKIKPSIRLKHLKRALLSEVLDDPSKNTNEYLRERVIELNKLSDEELIKLSPDIEAEEKERQKNLLKGFKGVE